MNRDCWWGWMTCESESRRSLRHGAGPPSRSMLAIGLLHWILAWIATFVQQVEVLDEIGGSAGIWRLCEEWMNQDFVDGESVGWVPLEQIFKQVDAAVREGVEAISYFVVFRPAHLLQVVTVFKLKEIAPVFLTLGFADQVTDLQILVNLVAPWQHRSALVEKLGKDATDGPDVARLSILSAPK